jgi:phosphohistidine swiveling domain-containing protein
MQMRVVVSVAVGDGGGDIAKELALRDHTVGHLPTDRWSPDIDAVVHLTSTGRGIDAVVDATQRAGVARLVLISPAAVEYPATASDVSVLLVRTATVMGRDTSGAVQRRFCAPAIVGVKNGCNRAQFVHPDDVTRFVAEAVEHPDWTGPMNLAATDTLTLREVAAILGKRYLEARRVSSEPPVVDIERLGELGFVPAWSSRECVTDFRLANREHIYLGAKRIRLRWRFPWARAPVPAQLPRRRPASDSGGEFDTEVDPQWPVYTAVNTSEAFPGPMTPLSLELSLQGMRAMGAQAVDVLRLDGELGRAVIEEQTGSFGHRVYANLSVLFATGAVLPGADPSGWRDKLFGRSGAAVPAIDKIGWWGMAVRLPRMLAFIFAGIVQTRRMDKDARACQRGAVNCARLSDDQLRSQLRCTHDQVVSAWAVAALITLAIVPILGVLERLAGRSIDTEFMGGTEKLASAGLILATHRLAEQARVDAAIAAILRDHPSEEALRRLRDQHPGFVARLDQVIAEWGHRGPGETELINPVFADRRARLLDVVAKLAGGAERGFAPTASMSPWVRFLAWVGAWFQRSRERARDAAIRLTHEYRLIAREIGMRLVSQEVIEQRDDVFYLVQDEVLHPPLDVRYLVLRRKVERQRLERERPPMDFVQRWKPDEDGVEELSAGESLTGLPASSGVAKGRVRVVTAESIIDLQPGEILVAESIDVGWTPFFSYAAAVVVDTGAMMSHAAIVAREFGIPCVVGSKTGSRALRSGHVVEVDGASGRVTRVE